MSRHDVTVHDLLNGQTGRVAWEELERHFARGVLVSVDRQQDLVGIAAMLVEDDTGQFSELVDSGLLRCAGDDDAIRWQKQNASFWAVVVAPWVLVQEIQRPG